MWEKYHYIGCFFATEDFKKKKKNIEKILWNSRLKSRILRFPISRTR